MSKSLGNSPDALKLIETYGADGVRVGLLLSSAAGNDLMFDEDLCQQGKGFVNKIWNAFRLIKGWEVDAACRGVIEAAGYGEFYVHRTGHSIGQEVHGNGANMDNLETREDRLVMRQTCFSVEPGIYLPEFGVRSEVDVFVDSAGQVHVTGGDLQTEIVPILNNA